MKAFRILLVGLFLLLGAVVAVAPFMGLAWAGWALLAEIGGTRAWGVLQDAAAPILGYRPARAPAPPRPAAWAMVAGGIAIAPVLLAWLAHSLIPLRSRIRRAYTGAQRADSSSGLAREVRRLARRVGAGWVGVWVIPGGAIQAGAWAAPGRGAIMVTEGVLQLPQEERHWVIAHELGHLRAGDPLVGALWLAVGDGLQVAARLRVHLLRLGFRLTRFIPVIGHLLAFGLRGLVTALVLLDRVAGFARRGVRLFDRWLERRSELAADAVAEQTVGTQAGKRLLSRFGAGTWFEGLDPWRSHPTIQRRIRALGD